MVYVHLVLVILFVAVVMWDHFRVFWRGRHPLPEDPTHPVALQAGAARRVPDPEALVVHGPKLWPRLQSFLVPVVGGAILATAGAIFKYNATDASNQAQLADLQRRLAESDRRIEDNAASMRKLLERLPKDYVPRWEHTHDEELVRATREEDEERLAPIAPAARPRRDRLTPARAPR